MLFDHGSDAVTGFLLGVQVMKLLHLPYSFQLFGVYSFIMSLYFCAMWSQYCVGLFKLNRINPVDEGLPFYAICCFIATQLDLSFLEKEHIYGTYA
jgi:ethanolaminephosphotransferase